MEEQEIKSLLNKYKAGHATDDEKAILDKWYLHVAADRSEELSAEARLETLDEVRAHLQTISKSKVRTFWPRIAAAASVLLIISVGIYFSFHKQFKPQIAQEQKQDIAPGGNKAVLTLANGQEIIVTNAKQGMLAIQGHVTINKTANGRIVYKGNAGMANGAVRYNTITTPKGGQYWITLSDDTKVLLNAASSLKYPTEFNGKERLVELTGEAYFEVAHNGKVPFKVKTGAQLVEDVGTHFNIKAYNDEPAITTTLLEGAVNVSLIGNGIVKTIPLKPNQQSRINNGNIALIPNADVALATGWIDGRFRFKDAAIEDVMRELARWYNFEVVYQGPLTDERFNAIISRNRNISSALYILEKTKGVHFKIEGRRVTVLNKF